MTTENIAETKLEAQRFLQRVDEWEKSHYTYEIRGGDPYMRYGVKESGSLRRSSMDLTRSLAKMRKPS